MVMAILIESRSNIPTYDQKAYLCRCSGRERGNSYVDGWHANTYNSDIGMYALLSGFTRIMDSALI